MVNEAYTIGFANLDEDNPFAARLRAGLEKAAAQHDNVSLMVRDNDLDLQKAQANVEEFIRQPVDLVMIYHIDERGGAQLVGPLFQANIPVISIIHAISLTTYVGLDNQQAGQMVGEDLANWIEAHWDGQLDKVIALTNQRTVKSVPQRISAALDELVARIDFDRDHVLYLDDGGLPETTAERTQGILTEWSEFRHIVIIALGDHIAHAALEAARALGREQDVIVGGMDGIFMPEEATTEPTSRLLYSLSFDTEHIGEQLLDLAIKTLQGERIPRQHLISPKRLTHPSLR